MEAHEISVMDIRMGHMQIANIFSEPHGHVLYLHCDICDSNECYHIKYVLVVPKLREALKKFLEKNGYSLPKKYTEFMEEMGWKCEEKEEIW